MCIDFRKDKGIFFFFFLHENSRYLGGAREIESAREYDEKGRKPNSEQIPLDEHIYIDDVAVIHTHTYIYMYVYIYTYSEHRQKERETCTYTYTWGAKEEEEKRKRRRRGKRGERGEARGTNVRGRVVANA